jgi:glycosyltransferase involved in cell wall biosynthesis
MFESWVTGVPFVTADVGDRRILAGDPPAALIVFPGKSLELVKWIIYIMRNEDDAINITNIGIRRAANYYWQNLIANFQVNIN